MNKSYRKMIDWLYSKNNVSDFQKGLRLYMMLKYNQYKMEELLKVIKK